MFKKLVFLKPSKKYKRKNEKLDSGLNIRSTIKEYIRRKNWEIFLEWKQKGKEIDMRNSSMPTENFRRKKYLRNKGEGLKVR